MASPIEIQEDVFDDVNWDTDERLSEFEEGDDFFIGEAIEAYENCPKTRAPLRSIQFKPPFPRLTTITEESQSHYSTESAQPNTSMIIDDCAIAKSDFQIGSIIDRRQLDLDEKSFFGNKNENEVKIDDRKFKNAIKEKENSWEPSIHQSPPPMPRLTPIDEEEECKSIEEVTFRQCPSLANGTKNNGEEENSKSLSDLNSLNVTRTPEAKSNAKSNLDDKKMSTPNGNNPIRNPFSVCNISEIRSDNDIKKNEQCSAAKSHFKVPVNKYNENEEFVEYDTVRLLLTESFMKLDESDIANALIEAKKGIPVSHIRAKRNLPPLRGPLSERNILNVNQGSCQTRLNTKSRTNKDDESLLNSKTGQQSLLSSSASFIYFGFVDVGVQVNRRLRIRNISSKNLCLKLKLQSANKGFEVHEQGLTTLKANEVFEIRLVFKPTLPACYRNALQIIPLNAEHLRYSIPLMGSGGVASLHVRQQNNLDMLRDGSFVLSVRDYSNFTFEVINKGVRDGFVRVLALSPDTSKPLNNVNILPSNCVTILRRHSQKFEVQLDVRKEDDKSETSRSSLTNRLQIRLEWGEEAQRRRLRRFEDLSNTHWTWQDFSFSKTKFFNEESSKKTAVEETLVGPYDREVFELSLRIITISVINNRMRTVVMQSFSTENSEAKSVILEPCSLYPSNESKAIIPDVSVMSVVFPS